MGTDEQIFTDIPQKVKITKKEKEEIKLKKIEKIKDDIKLRFLKTNKLPTNRSSRISDEFGSPKIQYDYIEKFTDKRDPLHDADFSKWASDCGFISFKQNNVIKV